jgi:hypothetical protein
LPPPKFPPKPPPPMLPPKPPNCALASVPLANNHVSASAATSPRLSVGMYVRIPPAQRGKRPPRRRKLAQQITQNGRRRERIRSRGAGTPKCASSVAIVRGSMANACRDVDCLSVSGEQAQKGGGPWVDDDRQPLAPHAVRVSNSPAACWYLINQGCLGAAGIATGVFPRAVESCSWAWL